MNKKKLTSQMIIVLEKSIAVYELLHAHARGETDLTEDQLANVVTGVNLEARDVLARVTGVDSPHARGPHGWVADAQRRASRASRRLHS